jgi:hypothetical protein
MDFSCKFIDVRCALDTFAVEKADERGIGVKLNAYGATLRYLLTSYEGDQEALLCGESDWARCIKHVNWSGTTDRTVFLYYEFPYRRGHLTATSVMPNELQS